MTGRTLITRVGLQNYKSIVGCDVLLGPLTILVGPNGSGKSNFLDALRFVAEALTNGLDQAVRSRGRADDILSRSAVAAGSHEVGIELHLALASGTTARYAFSLGVKSIGGYTVRREECAVSRPANSEGAFYVVENGGDLVGWGGLALDADIAPARVHDRLYLVNASGLPEFRAVYDMLAGMTFYNLNPARMREPRKPDPGLALLPDGANVTSVLRRLHEREPKTKRRLEEFLAQITPGFRQVVTRKSSSFETLQFRQWGSNPRDAWRFQSDQVSDGTLRALGVLVALFQVGPRGGPRASLVGIEEPENALHPAAAGVLLDALADAAETRQVVVTSHSPALLDRDDLDPAMLRAVITEQGSTRIGQVDGASRLVLQQHLYTAGELLRMGQLSPEPDGTQESKSEVATPAE